MSQIFEEVGNNFKNKIDHEFNTRLHDNSCLNNPRKEVAEIKEAKSKEMAISFQFPYLGSSPSSVKDKNRSAEKALKQVYCIFCKLLNTITSSIKPSPQHFDRTNEHVK